MESQAARRLCRSANAKALPRSNRLTGYVTDSLGRALELYYEAAHDHLLCFDARPAVQLRPTDDGVVLRVSFASDAVHSRLQDALHRTGAVMPP